jgi:hypothetical protein
MAFFRIDGSVIPVAQNSVNRTFQEIGDRERSFDGTLRETIRSRVSLYEGATIPMTWADASSVIASLNTSTQPQNCDGTMLSSGGATVVAMFTRAIKSKPMQSGSEEVFVVNWEAEESS